MGDGESNASERDVLWKNAKAELQKVEEKLGKAIARGEEEEATGQAEAEGEATDGEGNELKRLTYEATLAELTRLEEMLKTLMEEIKFGRIEEELEQRARLEEEREALEEAQPKRSSLEEETDERDAALREDKGPQEEEKGQGYDEDEDEDRTDEVEPPASAAPAQSEGSAWQWPGSNPCGRSQPPIDDMGHVFQLSQLLFFVGRVFVKHIASLLEWKRRKDEREFVEKLAVSKGSTDKVSKGCEKL
ncbi:hypothetical protein CONPUDRAFT_156761 [Coniophora puteana RWD-64-598 SS2]|uniref:Uncharacterized protein n=1 Tax=Coniophora puteana (strain RWD-64-598) TaxID=741705 RepID=A0A5M3ME94_CONPW|nr:uncharacterized protein CONPUDRAFT_156761 [Coniophora puteana RWD-64-598 SS2]EIW77542.1 hypothetical protein CONPUDRAFT_156761 [Coniophora puteana RWD-64-598 SS2]